MSNNAIVQGSLSQIAAQSGKSLAESFIHCDAVVIVDTSGSMDANDAQGVTRYTAACRELTALQATQPGRIAVISFSDRAVFCPGGIPEFLGSGTDMAAALQFARIADVPGMGFYLISDGQPDDEGETLRIARQFQNRINTIFVGPEGDRGQEFLQRLAAATGAASYVAELTRALGATIEQAMLTAG